VEASAVDDVLERLDHRERGGYERHPVEVRDAADQVFAEALVYVATRENRNYLGPAPASTIADQIRQSHGPSGANREYVLRLADALREMGIQDEHVLELDRLLRSGT